MEAPRREATARAMRSRFERTDGIEIAIQPRDLVIFSYLHEHRFATLPLIAAWLDFRAGTRTDLGNSGLGKRVRLLYDAGYLARLEITMGDRTKALIYALTAKSEGELRAHYRAHGIAGRVAVPDVRTRGWGHPQHEVGVAHVTTCLRLALQRLTLQDSAWRHEWTPYPLKREAILRIREVTPEGETVEATVWPDGFFRIFHTQFAGEAVNVFLELDRAHRSAERYATPSGRYGLYHQFYRYHRTNGFAEMRVVTITETEARLEALRSAIAARDEFKNKRTGLPWGALRFATLSDISLENPMSVMNPIYRFAVGEKRVGLL